MVSLSSLGSDLPTNYSGSKFSARARRELPLRRKSQLRDAGSPHQNDGPVKLMHFSPQAFATRKMIIFGTIPTSGPVSYLSSAWLDGKMGEKIVITWSRGEREFCHTRNLNGWGEIKLPHGGGTVIAPTWVERHGTKPSRT